jgi:hypothetical protein
MNVTQPTADDHAHHQTLAREEHSACMGSLENKTGTCSISSENKRRLHEIEHVPVSFSRRIHAFPGRGANASMALTISKPSINLPQIAVSIGVGAG